MSRDTNMRGQATRARAYSYAQHGRLAKGLPGNHLIRPDAGNVSVWKPSWKGTTTTIRIYPVMDPGNPEVFDPWRFSADDNDWGDWIRTYPAVRNFGDPGVTFILYDPADQAYDPQINPAWMLFRAIDNAVAAGQGQPHWAPLLRGAPGRGERLRKPSEVSLVQCAIVQHNSKPCTPPRGGAIDDGTVVFELAPSATKAMFGLMNERRKDYHGPLDDFDNSFEYGDPVSLHMGRFINFFQLGFDPREKERVNATRRTSSFGQSRAAAAGDSGGENEDKGYGCFISDDYDGMPPELTHVESMIRSKVKAWDDIIFIPTHEEQVRWISSAFPPDVVVYALGDYYGDAIPEGVYNAAANRAQVVVPPPMPAAPPRGVGRRGFGASTGDGQAAPADPSAPPPQEQVPEPAIVAGDPVPAAPTSNGRRRLEPPQPVAQQPSPQAPPAPPVSNRGFGGQSASPTPQGGNQSVPAETAPQGGIPEPVAGEGVLAFDPPPAPTAPAASSAAVQSAIQNSRRRIANRGAAQPQQ